MAERVYNQDIIDVDLDQRGTIARSFISRSIGSGDNRANRFGVRLFRKGVPLDLGEASCEGFFRDSHGNNILIQGTTSGYYAYVTLPQACYNYDGQFVLAIKVIDANETSTVRIVDGVVDNTNCDHAVAPTGTVPTYQEVLAIYNQAVAALGGMVRHDVVQSLSEESKARARANIGAYSQADLDTLGLYVADGYLCQRLQGE